MFTLNDNSNKHKVAFYVALVILLVTLGQIVDATEVISHSSPKNTSTDVSVIRGYDANKSVAEKLIEIRQLIRSLIFDWNLGESGIENGRTFGRIRMMKNIFLPVAFIGGFLTAVIFSIKAIGIVNLFLISSLLALNLAVIVGKLVYAKKVGHGVSQTHYHSHFNQQPPSYPSYPTYIPYGSYPGGGHSSSYAHANSRVDDGLPFGRNFDDQPNFEPKESFSNQIPAFQNQASLNFNQQSINSQYPTALNNLQEPQQPPSYFQPQMNAIPQNINNIGNNQVQQQQQTTSNSFNQPLNRLFSRFHALNNDMNFMSNDIQSSVPTYEITTTPSSGVKMINFQEIKPQSSFSPLEMEKILTNALARISESKRVVPTTALPSVFRFKRKSSNHQPYLNLLRPFS